MVAIDEVCICPEQIGDRADLLAFFGRRAPIELEIGCGKGAFLLRQARAHPERDYLGIEWCNKIYKYAADRMARWGVENVRILRTDAREFVLRKLSPASLAAVHVYHPDPWPKKRHHKRRLFNAAFVNAVTTVLQPGGRLAIQTDHREYFDVIHALTTSHAMLVQVPFEAAEFGTIGEQTQTNYEIKYVREGRAIYRLAFIRREGAE